MVCEDFDEPGRASSDMGERLSNIIRLMEQSPIDELTTFLDIGIGDGQIAKWLAKKGKKVTGTGIEVDSYDMSSAELKKEYGIDVIECSAEHMQFDNNSFDGIVMSHVLEHCHNVGLALQEVRRVLSDEGYLFIILPSHCHYVFAGHVSVGWNVGQLMYVLLVNGYDVKNGQFIEYQGQVYGLVQKSLNPLPPLRGDSGDISILAQNNLFPLPVITKDKRNDGYWGNIKAINFSSSDDLLRMSVSPQDRYRLPKQLLLLLVKLLPRKIRYRIGRLFTWLGNTLTQMDFINPRALTD